MAGQCSTSAATRCAAFHGHALMMGKPFSLVQVNTYKVQLFMHKVPDILYGCDIFTGNYASIYETLSVGSTDDGLTFACWCISSILR